MKNINENENKNINENINMTTYKYLKEEILFDQFLAFLKLQLSLVKIKLKGWREMR